MKYAARAHEHADVRLPTQAPVHERVYCSIADTNARSDIAALIERMHGDPVFNEDAARTLWTDGALDSCVGVIYDLAPWTLAATEAVIRLRRVRPGVSILLYPPVSDQVEELLAQCMSLTGVRVRFQTGQRDDVPSLENDILWVLHSHTLQQLTVLARGALGQPPPRIATFIHRYLNSLCGGRRAKVDELARAANVSPRTLERDFAYARFPTPKETADWLTLLYLAYVSNRYAMRLSRIARPLHITPNHIYRLKRRLLTDYTWSARTASGDLLSAILIRLARRVQGAKMH